MVVEKLKSTCVLEKKKQQQEYSVVVLKEKSATVHMITMYG